MSILNLFLSPLQRKGMAHVKNLIQMALADGKLDEREIAFLKQLAGLYKIPENTVAKLLEKSSTTKVNLHKVMCMPKYEQLYDLVKMMMIDNDIAKEELEMCISFAKRMGFQETKAKELIDSIRQNIAIGNNREDTKLRVLYLLR